VPGQGALFTMLGHNQLFTLHGSPLRTYLCPQRYYYNYYLRNLPYMPNNRYPACRRRQWPTTCPPNRF